MRAYAVRLLGLHRIEFSVHTEGEWAERGEVTLIEAARMLNLSPITVLRQIRAGTIPAEQYCKGAPWVPPLPRAVTLPHGSA
jgi:hypothetical protein